MMVLLPYFMIAGIFLLLSKLANKRHFHVMPVAMATLFAALQWIANEVGRNQVVENYEQDITLAGILFVLGIVLTILAWGRNETIANSENAWFFLLYTTVFALISAFSNPNFMLHWEQENGLGFVFISFILALIFFRQLQKRLTASTSSPYKVTNRASIVLKLIGKDTFFLLLGVAVLGATLFTTIASWSFVSLRWEAKSWADTHCAVESYSITVHESDDSTSYRLHLLYFVDDGFGRSHLGNNMGEHYSSFGSRNNAEAKGALLKSQGVACYYDVHDPSRSLTNRTIGFAPLLYSIALGVLLFGFRLMGAWRDSVKKSFQRLRVGNRIAATRSIQSPLVLDPMLIADQVREEEWLARMSDWTQRMLPWDRKHYTPLNPPFSGEELRQHLQETKPLLERGRTWFWAMTPIRYAVQTWEDLSVYQDSQNEKTSLNQLHVDFRTQKPFTYSSVSLSRTERPYFWAYVSTLMFLLGLLVFVHAFFEPELAHPGEWVAGFLYLGGFGTWSLVAVIKARVARPQFLLTTNAVYPGAVFRLAWQFSNAKQKRRGFGIKLIGEEWSVYSQGTKKITSVREVYSAKVLHKKSSKKMKGHVKVTLPEGLPPTFDVSHSGIRWYFKVDYGNFEETYPFTVLSKPSNQFL